MNSRQKMINAEFAHFEKFLRQCRWAHVDAGLVAALEGPLLPAERERVDQAAVEGRLPFPEEPQADGRGDRGRATKSRQMPGGQQ